MLYWESRTNGHTQAVRIGNWKVVKPANAKGLDELELYDLASDPHESSNKAADHPDLIKEFLKGT